MNAAFVILAVAYLTLAWAWVRERRSRRFWQHQAIEQLGLLIECDKAIRALLSAQQAREAADEVKVRIAAIARRQ